MKGVDIVLKIQNGLGIWNSFRTSPFSTLNYDYTNEESNNVFDVCHQAHDHSFNVEKHISC